MARFLFFSNIEVRESGKGRDPGGGVYVFLSSYIDTLVAFLPFLIFLSQISFLVPFFFLSLHSYNLLPTSLVLLHHFFEDVLFILLNYR